MELITAYLYNQTPIQTNQIHYRTIAKLLTEGWYKDTRSPKKFQLLNKRFYIESVQKWYRVILRFEEMESNIFQLNAPIPFVVVETYTEDGVQFQDKQVFHGKEVKRTIGYFDKGVPTELMDRVIHDLKENVIYADGGRHVESQLDVDLSQAPAFLDIINVNIGLN